MVREVNVFSQLFHFVSEIFCPFYANRKGKILTHTHTHSFIFLSASQRAIHVCMHTSCIGKE